MKSSCNLGGNVNGEATMENSMDAQGTQGIEVSYDPAIPFVGFSPEKITIQTDMCILIFRAALFIQASPRIHQNPPTGK